MTNLEAAALGLLMLFLLFVVALMIRPDGLAPFSVLLVGLLFLWVIK